MGFTLRVPRGVIVAITPFNYPTPAPAGHAQNRPGPRHRQRRHPQTDLGDPPLGPKNLRNHRRQRLPRTRPYNASPAAATKSAIGSSATTGRPQKSASPAVPPSAPTSPPAPGVKPLSLELGSNCPCIVLPDADMKQVADLSAVGGYGQRRTSLPLFTARTRAARNLRRLPRRHHRPPPSKKSPSARRTTKTPNSRR